MDETLQFFQQGLWLAIVLSAPPLLIATASGVVVALVQAITQVQDQTLPYVIKLAVVAITLSMLGRWFTAELVGLTEMAFRLIPAVGR
jgi:type III secretion protein S